MKININGKWIEKSNSISLYELKKEYYAHCDITILNGFQTEENIGLSNGDRVVFMQRGTFPTENELEQMLTARHTPKVYEQVKKAKVAIAGLGGLGSTIALMLARTGIGKLLLIDFDIVEPSNLNRQCYFIKHLGMKKTEALKQQIADCNPYVQVEINTIKVEEHMIDSLFYGYDIICEAFDSPYYKAMLINTLLEKLPSVKIVSASGMAGFESSNTIQTYQKFKNLYVCGDLKSDAKPGRGLMAPRVSICAGHQANMILRLLLGIENV